MTAVQGIEFLPPRESERLPVKDVKSKGEISPFEQLLTRDNVEDKSRTEKTDTDNSSTGEKSSPLSEKDGPQHPSLYSTEKLAALLKGTMGPGELPDEEGDQNSLNKAISLLDIKSEQDLMMPASQWETEVMSDNRSENMKKIISLLLKGEMNSEELEKLVLSAQDPAIGTDPLLKGLKERILSSEDSTEKTLKGLLTEDGELVYFNEKILNEKIKVLKGNRETNQKGADTPKNKVVMEISVTDLREKKGQNASTIAQAQENSIIKASLKGETAEKRDRDITGDLLGTPAEKLFSPEGGGGKLQAPVSREVSRMFQDYMKDTGSRDLVKKIDFILKNENQGEIKLILKPEALGNVRINLSLNENNIAGKIFVDNSSVRDIFLNNMNQIINQLKSHGYDEATLEVWVGQEGQSGQQGQQESDQNKEYRIAERIKKFDLSVPQVAPGSYVNDGEVNLVV